MKKKNVLRIIGVILLIILVVFLIHIIRNYIILKDLNNKINQYANCTNFYTKSVTKENNEVTINIEYYEKDGRKVVFLTRNLDGNISKMSTYINGDRKDTFIETSDSKIAQLNDGMDIQVSIYNYTEYMNWIEMLISSIGANIKTTEYNGKECYVISNNISSISLLNKNTDIYIEKDTGLLLKIDENGKITERQYVFNNVQDSIFIEPNIGEYTIK